MPPEGPNTERGGVEQAPVDKKPFDLSKLIADSRLTKEEISVVKEAYGKEKQALIDATKGVKKDFIERDYRYANENALGGREGVKNLQAKLNLPANGIFDSETFFAILEYQKTNGLTKIDGIAGPETMGKMGILKIEGG